MHEEESTNQPDCLTCRLLQKKICLFIELAENLIVHHNNNVDSDEKDVNIELFELRQDARTIGCSNHNTDWDYRNKSKL